MDREKQILKAFEDEMRRHNSVKRRIAIIETIVLACLSIFCLISLFALFFMSLEKMYN